MSVGSNFEFTPVISVDRDKCVNCHYCIEVCPVKYCNNASDFNKGITINHDLCIGCGACIKACTHQARIALDDTAQFFNDLKQGEKIAILVAPSTDVNFPNQLKKLLGWLKGQGVTMSFDVSLGAEITTYQYLQALKKGAKTPMIAQPCPCVVAYIEIYEPELIDHLAPTQSPVTDMAIWVQAHYPDYKLAFISPCIAKKREFEDPDSGNRIQYNVTIAGLKRYLEQNGVDLEGCPEVDFDGPMAAERGLLYSQPGGLHETLKRYNLPLKLHQVRRVEGPEVFTEFFKELKQEIASGSTDVILIDILNCEHGCNRGTGTIYHERTTGEVLKRQSDRLEQHQSSYYSKEENCEKLEQFLEDMNDLDFSRSYTDFSGHYAALMDPTPEMIEVLHQEMGKTDPKDIKNCGACGYNSCDNMAKAILNGLYRPQQCHHFLEKFYRDQTNDLS